MKRKIIPFALFVATFSFAQSQTQPEITQHVEQKTSQKIIISEGTLVKAALKNEIRGGSMKIGDQIEFILNQPIVVGDQVVIAPGAKIIGTINEARASGVLGRKGKLGFTIDYLY